MTSGYARKDLSRIKTADWRAECAERACRVIHKGVVGKPKAIRIARVHAAQTGHDVILYAETVQRVSAFPLLRHEPVELTGGSIPAHVPGAYPRLSCCGGSIEVVPA